MLTTQHTLPVILPTKHHINRYYSELSVCSKTDYQIDQLLGEVCQAIEYSRPDHLIRYIDALYDRLESTLGGDDSSLICKATLDLGVALRDIYIGRGLYNDQGRCNHYYSRLLGKDILLEVYPPEYIPQSGRRHDHTANVAGSTNPSDYGRTPQRPRHPI